MKNGFQTLENEVHIINSHKLINSKNSARRKKIYYLPVNPYNIIQQLDKRSHILVGNKASEKVGNSILKFNHFKVHNS